MSALSFLRSLRLGKNRRRTARRRGMGTLRMLRVESLESRMVLSAMPPTLALEPPDDSGTPGDCTTIEPQCADILESLDSPAGVQIEPETTVADAPDIATYPISEGTSGLSPATIRDLQVDEDGILSGTAASDGVRACRKVELDLDNNGAADIYTFSNESDRFMYDLGLSVRTEQHVVQARTLEFTVDDSVEAFGDWSAVIVAVPQSRLISAAEGEFPGSVGTTMPTGPTTPAAPTTPPIPVGPLEETTSLAPVITSFTVGAGTGGTWFLNGTVEHEEPWTLTVVFGGVVSGSVSVQNDGTFFYAVILPPGANGIVNAQAFDSPSNVVFEWIT